MSAEAKAEWKRVVPELERLKLLKMASRSSLAAYCETWATFVLAQCQIAREGLTIDAKQGTLPHPAVGIARNASRDLRGWCAEFGLTPSAEGRMPTGESDGEDDDSLLD
jgi:P27 family predicted phage terminase small subunit